MAHERDDGRDRRLFADLASGRTEALAEVYDHHAASLLRHALSLTRRRAEAEDLIHAVFVKLAATGAPLLGVRKPAAYLHRMVSTAWFDLQRRAVTGERVIEQNADSLTPRHGSMEDAFDVTRALDDLPARQREAIVLHLVEGFSFLEIGRLTGVSLFTAAARYRLALARMRKALAHGVGVKETR